MTGVPAGSTPAAGRGGISGHLLVRNSLLNLLGHGAPLLVAIVAIPLLIEGLGTERFGVLTLAWMVIGYFSLFDLGLSRALTQLVAERLGRGAEDEVPSLGLTALALMLALGAAGTLVLAALTPGLVRDRLSVPATLRGETITAFYLLALSLPCVITTAGLRGLLEASQRFGLVNALRVPMGIFTFAGPLLVLPFSNSLVPVTAVLVAGRVAAWAAHVVGCLTAFPDLGRRGALRAGHVRTLLRFGGWMTVSNVVSPLMVYFDRFLIASLLSLAAVAHYVTPYEVVIKLLLVPSALLGVFFPAFALASSQDPARITPLFDRVLRVLLLVLFPVCLVLVVGAREGLTLWLDAGFAAQSTRVLQWLAIGVFVNALAHAPFALIQGLGRPDFTGKLHLVELPCYAVALWWLTGEFGIVGAAVTWTVRVTLDAAVLLTRAVHLLPARGHMLGATIACCAAATLTLVVAIPLRGAGPRLAFLVLALLVFALFGWARLIAPGERVWIRRALGSRSAEPASLSR